jgi:hypothetical protein
MLINNKHPPVAKPNKLETVGTGAASCPSQVGIEILEQQASAVTPRQLFTRRFTRETLLQIDHAHQHVAAWVEGQVLETPSGVEAANVVVERVGDDAHAADIPGSLQGRPEREQQEGRGMAVALIVLIDRELTEKRDWYRIGPVALLRLGQERAFDVRGAQGDIADDPPRCGIGDDVDARDAAYVVGPGVAAEPAIERVTAAVDKLTSECWA